MAIQNKVLTVEADGSTVYKAPNHTAATLQGSKGVLALGKPGDIATRAYGPVVRSAVIVAADIASGATNVPFGGYVAGKGILVNSDDCAAVGPKFDTVYGLVAGQVGSWLVSGACIVKQSQLAAILAGMNVQAIGPEYSSSATYTGNEVFEVEVNGFKATAG